jgi:hypothetical protein
MKMQITNLLSGLFCLLLFFTACQPDKPKEGEVKEPAGGTDLMATFIDGKLDTLWVADTAFTKLAKNSSVYFSYFFNTKDTTLTLHGWKTKKKPGGYEFDNDPDIVLANGTESQQAFGTKFYLSPIYLTDKVLDVIKDSITLKGYKFVVFAPTSYGTNTTYGNLIKYKILLSKGQPFSMMMMQADSASGANTMNFIDPNLDANPSPPKQNY